MSRALLMYLIFNPKKYFELNFDLDFYCFQLTGKLQLLWKVFLMRREVPGVPNGILSCPVLPMPLALVTFGGSPISASRTVVVSVFLRFSTIFAKGGFFSESAIRFLDLQISKKTIFQKTIFNLKFKFPTNNSKVLLAGNLDFKLRIVFLEYFFF